MPTLREMNMSENMSATPIENAATFLFVPGTRPDRFHKALSSGAHQVIIDLEDAVAPALKQDARLAVEEWRGDARVIVRINDANSPYYEDDVAMAARHPCLAAVMLPKAASPDEVERLQANLGKPIIPLIESAIGLAQVRQIAGAVGVIRLAFGSIDLALDLGLSAPDAAMDGFRLELTLASRLACIAPPIDGVLPDFKNSNQLAADTVRARSLGYCGKLCIHPSQVDTVNQSFSLTLDEIAWAQNIVALGENAVAVDGAMVDRPIRERALRILARARLPSEAS